MEMDQDHAAGNGASSADGTADGAVAELSALKEELKKVMSWPDLHPPHLIFRQPKT